MSTLRMTFVHVAEQVHYEPVTARLAGLVKSMSWWPWQILTDFSTTEDVFVHQVREHDPMAVVFRVTKQNREVVQYLAHVVHEQPEAVPTFFFGPLCQSHPEEVVGLAPRAVILTGEPEVGMRNVLAEWPAGPIPPEPPPGVWYCWDGDVKRGESGGTMKDSIKPDLNVFGGDRVFRRGIGASMFGDLKVLPMLESLGSPAGPSPNANLSIFGYDTREEPRCHDVDELIFRLRVVGPRVHHFEFWDREFGWDPEHGERLLAVLHRKQKKKTYSLRVLAESFDPRMLEWMQPRFGRRVITELDAATEEAHAAVPGSQDPAKVAQVVDEARSAGFEPALIVSVGLPFETVSDIERKLAFIDEHGVGRVRFVPFEPRYDHPVWALCDQGGMLDRGGESWNREVHKPLAQDCLTEAEWPAIWQRCLDAQARLQLMNPLEFAPRKREEAT